jgi:hypothetical protein
MFNEIACGQGTFTAQAGETYYFMIGAIGGGPYPNPYGGGQLHFVVSQLVMAQNDSFAGALVVGDLPFDGAVDIGTISVEPEEPRPSCAWNTFEKTAWYAVTPAVSGVLKVHSTGSSTSTFSAVWTGPALNSLAELDCASYYEGWINLNVTAGETYYIQTGPFVSANEGSLNIHLELVTAPGNDAFSQAEPVNSIPFSFAGHNWAASTEPGEPSPSCSWNGANNTVWFSFTPAVSQSYNLTLPEAFGYNVVAVYAGQSLENLSEIGCRTDLGYNHLAVHLEAGETYYYQVGSHYDFGQGEFSLIIDVTPPPQANFYYWPGDPSMFDDIQFGDQSWDPYYTGYSAFEWNFGDGSLGSSSNPVHRYAVDGDYTVWHKVTTNDFRSAEVSQVVQVRTHDVGIGKFTVPTSARLNQTRPIVVGIRNARYSETVTVELYRSTPTGWVLVGQLTQTVPVRPANRTTEFSFNYTFTAEDAALGKVTFRAIAVIQAARDALQGDNEAISFAVKVTR